MKKETGFFYNPVSDFSKNRWDCFSEELIQDLGKQRSRVELFTVLIPQLKMKDRTVHVSGHTDPGNFLARCDFVPLLNEDFIADGIKRQKSVVMIEQHIFRIGVVI